MFLLIAPRSSALSMVATRRLVRCITSSPRRCRVLVVGSGRMGQIRASLIDSNPRLKLCGIVDPCSAPGESLAEKHGVSSFFLLRYPT
jgi:hypothetical protein